MSLVADKPTDRTIFQNAWVVEDLEAACWKWINELGVGPFTITDYTADTFSEITYRGEPSELALKVAIAHAGNVQIELIEPLSEQCAYRDSVPKGTTGFHHMCVFTLDFAADHAYFDKLGYPAANTGKVRDIEFAYFDTRPLMGCMLEVVTKTDSVIENFARYKSLAETWDGSDPIRYVT